MQVFKIPDNNVDNYEQINQEKVLILKKIISNFVYIQNINIQ
jgi:hypothetical protein